MNAAASGSSPFISIAASVVVSEPKPESADWKASAKASPPVLELLVEADVIDLERGGASLTCRWPSGKGPNSPRNPE